MNKRTNKWRILLGRIDWVLVGLVVVLGAVGILNLASASQTTAFSLHLSQSVWFLLGLGVVVGVCAVDYRLFERWSYIIYGLILLLLVAVLLVGTELNGSQRWLDLGFFLMQPSELLKVGVILVAARYFQDQRKAESYTLRDLAIPFLLVGLGLSLVVQQPDLGTSLVILIIFMSMVLFEGIDKVSFSILALVMVVAIPVGWNLGMQDYQKERVLAFLELDDEQYGASWQVRQSVIAFGSGQIWGKGHGEGTQVKKGFVPEHENDFVAANWGEEHGFLGMLFMLALYAALIMRALGISSRAKDTFGAHVAMGVAALVFWHVFFNLAMVTGLVPVVGLTLPFLSYGGSSLLTMLFATGLLMNVSIRRKPLSSRG